MTREQINSLTLPDVWSVLLERILEIDGPDRPYYLQEEGSTFYERIRVGEPYTKPPLEDLNNELILYKAMLIDELEAREAIIAKKQDIKDRLRNISDLRNVIDSLDLSISNLEIYKKNIINQLDEETLETLEAEAQRILPIINLQKQINDYKQLGLEKINKGKGVLALITGLNSSKENLTIQGVQRLLQVYQPIVLALSTGSLETAKASIVNTKPDSIFTAQDKSMVLQELNAQLQ